jgi:hypothetical protein
MTALGCGLDSWLYQPEVAGRFVASAGLAALLTARRHEPAPGDRRSAPRSNAAKMLAPRAQSRAGDAR